METSENAGSSGKIRVPAWTWLFVVACALIPGISLGGLIPSLIGGLGLTACYAVAHDPQQRLSVQQKVLACAGITLVAWGLFGGLVWVVGWKGGERTKTSSSSKRYRVVMHKGQVVYDSRLPSKPKRPLAEVDLEERQQIYALAQRYRSEVAELEEEIEEREGRMTLSLERKLDTLREKRREELEYVCDRFRLTDADLTLLIEEGDEAEWGQDSE